jgi:hypothetical protein
MMEQTIENDGGQHLIAGRTISSEIAGCSGIFWEQPLFTFEFLRLKLIRR